MEKYIQFKKYQIRQYEWKYEEYLKVAGNYRIIMVIAGIMIFIGSIFMFWATETLSATAFLIGTMFLVPGTILEVVFCKLRRHALKSADLLNQFAHELFKVLDRKDLDLEEIKSRILTVESNFLSNDDELYTKKFIWHPFLWYMQRKAYDKDARPEFVNVPVVWMNEDPLDLNNHDEDFVRVNWRIKRGIRHLYGADSQEKYRVLQNLGTMASRNPILFERFLRNKKISKMLKIY